MRILKWLTLGLVLFLAFVDNFVQADPLSGSSAELERPLTTRRSHPRRGKRGGWWCSDSFTYYTFQCCPRDGGWTSWTYSPCSVTCGRGVRTATRECLNPSPVCGGRSCVGSSRTTVDCSTPCPGCGPPSVPPHVRIAGTVRGSYDHGDVLGYTCEPGYRLHQQGPGGVDLLTSSVTCSVGQWGRFTPCADVDECQTGAHSCVAGRSRCVNSEGSHRCACLPGYVRVGSACKLPAINGGWSEWAVSGGCSRTCGGGQLRHERKCNNPAPRNGGAPCTGSDFQFRECNPECCAVTGRWSSWSDYGPCSKSCGMGTRTRTRTCTSPAPSCGGAACLGPASSTTSCGLVPCEKNCSLPSEEFFTGKVGLDMDREKFISSVPTFKSDSGDLYAVHGVGVAYGCRGGFKYENVTSGGTPRIMCDDGEWLGGGACSDVDECEEDIHGCRPDSSYCANTNGSFSCACRGGFQREPITGGCEDINECTQLAAPPCDQLCRNDKGSYQCYCRDGHHYNHTTRQCDNSVEDCGPVPSLDHGVVRCKAVPGVGQECRLECDLGYQLTSDVRDSTPQQCLGGQWSYQRANVPFPTCEDEFDFFLDDFFAVTTSTPCDPSSHDVGAFDDFTTLNAPENVTVTGVDCQPAFASVTGKRSTRGFVRVKLTVRKELSLSCRGACMEEESQKHREEILSRLSEQEGFLVRLRLEGAALVELTFVDLAPEQIAHLGFRKACKPHHQLINGGCSRCPPGHWYSAAGEVCEPCAVGWYRASSGGGRDCRACPKGLSTRTRGAGLCEERCPPGSHSGDGFPPCSLCPVGRYRDGSGGRFCHQCAHQWTTTSTGASSASHCGCPQGLYGQGCKRTCDCENGGFCTADGCVCTRGWTGANCTLRHDVARCQQTEYLVAFLDAFRRSGSKSLYVSSQQSPLNASIEKLVYLRTSQVTHLKIRVPKESSEVVQFPAYERSTAIVTIEPYHSAATLVGLLQGDVSVSVDAFSVLPVVPNPGYEEKFLVISVPSELHRAAGSFLQVIASSDNASVVISVTEDSLVQVGFHFFPISKGTERRVTLNRGQTAAVKSAHDLTGSSVKSTHGLAVYSGHECAQVPQQNPQSPGTCSHLVEQVPPVRLWGVEYVVTPFLGGGGVNSSFVKIVASVANASIGIHCMNIVSGRQQTTSVVLQGGCSHNFSLDGATVCRVAANRPILVAQFKQSEYTDSKQSVSPFMTIVPDVTKVVGNTSFATLRSRSADSRHYINLVVIADDDYIVDNCQSSIVLDGKQILLHGNRSSSEAEPTPDLESHHMIDFGMGKRYKVVRVAVSGDHHSLRHNMFGRLFGLVVYGYSEQASYGYSLGYEQVGSYCGTR